MTTPSMTIAEARAWEPSTDLEATLAPVDFEQCDACHGYGVDAGGYSCPTCRGEGVIPIWSEPE